MGHIKSLAFNREASTIGEINAVDYIKNELKKENIKTNLEYFKWVNPNRLVLRTIYIILICYMLILRLVLILLIYFLLKTMSYKTRGISLIKEKNSRNIIVEISAKNNKIRQPLIIISAHYDSIVSILPLKWHKLFNLVLKIIIIPFYLFILFLSVIITFFYYYELPIDDFFPSFVTISSLVGTYILPLFVLMFSSKKSESTGSIDNASGVAILIELVKLFNKNSPKNVNLLFLWCGAEEFGLYGSKKFCEKHFDELNQKFDLSNSFNINIDMVGTYIGLEDKIGLIKKKNVNYDLNSIIEATAKKLNISLIKFNSNIPTKSDHISFKSFSEKTNEKFQVCCFHSVKDCKFIHSVKDTPDKCSPEILNSCLEICFNVIKSIDLKGE